MKSEKELYCGLNIGEMSMQRNVIYDRQADRIARLVTTGCEAQTGGATEIANRLFCFNLRGLHYPRQAFFYHET